MKFTIEIDTDNEETAKELEEIIYKRVANEVGKRIVDKYIEDHSYWGTNMIGRMISDKIDAEIKLRTEHDMSERIIDKVVERVESKRDYQERVFMVKPFTEATKANEEYIMELVAKAIKKQFGGM